MARTRESSVVKLSPSDSTIHFDAFSDPSAEGTETYYDVARTFAAENKRLALDLQSASVDLELPIVALGPMTS